MPLMLERGVNTSPVMVMVMLASLRRRENQDYILKPLSLPFLVFHRNRA
jgi:hypothetical protein